MSYEFFVNMVLRKNDHEKEKPAVANFLDFVAIFVFMISRWVMIEHFETIA
jgi:hypothetical protein